MQFHLNQFVALVVASMSAAAIATTITKSSLFKPLRVRLRLSPFRWLRFLGKLFSCPYCMVHWVAALWVGIYQLSAITLFPYVDLILSWGATVFLSAVMSGCLLWLFRFPPDDDAQKYTIEEAMEFIKQARE
jgi:hypothetical protein